MTLRDPDITFGFPAYTGDDGDILEGARVVREPVLPWSTVVLLHATDRLTRADGLSIRRGQERAR